MNRRTTFALDDTAIKRLQLLSARWRVSQAEVIRRALEQAEMAETTKGPSPLERLHQYHLAGGLDSVVAESYIGEVYQQRSDWRRS